MDERERLEWMEWLVGLRNYTTAIQLHLTSGQEAARDYASTVDQLIAARLKVLGER